MKILILGGHDFLGKKLTEKDSDSFEVISTFNNHKIEHSKWKNKKYGTFFISFF